MEAATANFDAAKLKLWVVHPAFCRSRTGSHLEIWSCNTTNIKQWLESNKLVSLNIGVFYSVAGKPSPLSTFDMLDIAAANLHLPLTCFLQFVPLSRSHHTSLIFSNILCEFSGNRHMRLSMSVRSLGQSSVISSAAEALPQHLSTGRKLRPTLILRLDLCIQYSNCGWNDPLTTSSAV